MLNELLQHKNIILASGSPRRQEFFKDLGLNFKVVLKPTDESYPDHLKAEHIANHIAEEKAAAFTNLEPNDILITSDTIVWSGQKALGKPKDFREAKAMIASLSDKTHQVITSVCFKTKESIETVFSKTEVTFKKLTEQEICYYVEQFKPLDKAGAYGIQEWIGQIGITHIKGSYFNVVGLPVHLVYEMLTILAKR